MHMKWLSKLINPTVTPRQAPQRTNTVGLNVFVNAITAELVSGPDSTLMDKATFAVMPTVIELAAKHAAYKEKGESK